MRPKLKILQPGLNREAIMVAMPWRNDLADMPVKIKYVRQREIKIEVKVERPAWREYLTY